MGVTLYQPKLIFTPKEQKRKRGFDLTEGEWKRHTDDVKEREVEITEAMVSL